jgi:cell division protease FtsH
MSNDNKNPDRKKNFPGVLIFFIIGAFALLLMKNTGAEERANVSFSHQIEHLVNLDFLQAKHSNKVAINDNLVSFSGKFRDKKTEEGENRFRFLTLLDENKALSVEDKLAKEKMAASEIEMKKAAAYFYELTGNTKRGTFVIIPRLDKLGIQLDEVSLNMQKDDLPITNLKEVENLYAQVKKSSGESLELETLEIKLKSLVADFRSSKLGIGKKELKNILEESENLLQNSKDIVTFAVVIKNLKKVVSSLTKEVGGIKLYDLRSVRNYLEKREEFVSIASKYQDNQLKLAKAQSKVNDTIWFFNNGEVSSKALVAMDIEKYHRWYLGAKSEWEGFDKNADLVFRSPDQPRNLVLEKTFKSEQPAVNYFSYLFTLIPFLLIGGLMYFVFSKQMKGGASSAMNFGKSPAKQVLKGQQKITFDDVAGIDVAKEELEELVDFLKDPQRYKNLGARIPKGILLVGAPGTGKTLTAKAVAGEAGVPFFSISGSDFVEMFVGVGASRVRDLFEQARKNSPSIIFIDEIDAVGRHRGSGLGGGHDEREQTLNQLLVEIDGMDTVSGVIIIAATNRPDVLDKALLRPGRFDRSVSVEMPDYYGRLSILKVHAKKVKMDDDVNLKEIAGRTTGSVGADLENILNEAALFAAKKRRKKVTQEDLRYAQEKVQFGKERKSMIMNDEDIKTTAYHEAGHALCSMMLKTSDEVTMVTRVPRGRSLGATHFELKKNRVSYRKQELIDQLVVLMGGRCAEEIINKDPTSGAQMDIKQATNIARSMVKEWGMSDIVGMINYGDDANSNLMSGFHEREFSEETARVIDAEIKRLLDDAYKTSMELLTTNFEKLNLMATMLIEFEALDKSDLDKILDGSFSIDDKKKKVEEFESGAKRLPPALPKGLKKQTNTPPHEGPALA